jgi:nucleoside-diphosphate-sugar epimerase
LARVVTASRILITGAGGFIGTHLVREAKRRGAHVTALVHNPTDRLGDADIAQADLTTADLPKLLDRIQPTIIVNAASYGVGHNEKDEARMRDVNVAAVEKLITAAKRIGVKRFVQLGTYSEYGDQPATITEDTPLAPKEAYARTKADASGRVAAADGLETIVLRLFNVWGPFERPGRLLPQVILHCRAGTRFPLTLGTQIKEWCYVEDVAAWIMDLALMDRPWPHRIVNLGSGMRLSVRDMALAAARALGGEHLLDFGAVPIPAKEVQTGPADLTRVTALLPARRITSLAVGVAATIAVTP